MWNETFVLADRIKGLLVSCVGGLIVIAAATDVAGYADAAILPLTILGVFVQTLIATAALRCASG